MIKLIIKISIVILLIVILNIDKGNKDYRVMKRSYYTSEMISKDIFGGSANDAFNSVVKTKDGGYIAVGYTSSKDGDITEENNGSGEGLIVKYDNIGDVEWQKIYGGSDNDTINSISETKDGGYVAAGSTRSKDGDIIDKNTGEKQALIIKLDDEGNIEWQETFDGTEGTETFNEIKGTKDGGCIAVGDTRYIESDILMVKYNSEGDVEWQKTYGGSLNEYLYSIEETQNGEYIAVGMSESKDGDIVDGNNGKEDALILKVDGDGNVKWIKTYGGKNTDKLNSIVRTSDKGYVAAGSTQSKDGDIKDGINGYEDALIIKIDIEGNIEWGKTYGAEKGEVFNEIIETSDKGYLAVGVTNHYNPGDAKEYGDYLVMKLDSNGDIEWQKTYGGTKFDEFNEVIEISDGEYIAVGTTAFDATVVKVNDNSTEIE